MNDSVEGFAVSNDPLVGAWAKLGRATAHWLQLEAAIDTNAHEHPEPHFSMRRELNEQTGHGRFVVSRLREFPTEWSLLIGDCVTNARTALDYLAWVLVRLGTDPNPKEPKMVQFPIRESEEFFDADVAQQLPGVSDYHIRLIHDRQPIPSLPRFQTFRSLAWLNDYVNADRYHPLHVIQASQTRGEIRLTETKNFIVSTSEPGSVLSNTPVILEIGAELVRFHGTVTGPYPRMEVELEGQYAPSLPDGRPIRIVLPDIVEAVRAILRVFDSML